VSQKRPFLRHLSIELRIMLRRVTFVVVLILGLISVSNSQSQQSQCDFSDYKPLIISHALLKAAIKKVQPEYPPTGTWVKAAGIVQVKILVDHKGNVAEACVLKGHPLLRASAKKAALEWKFKENFGFSKKSKLVKRHQYIQSELVFNFNLD
jgi:hypothetical protein